MAAAFAEVGMALAGKGVVAVAMVVAGLALAEAAGGAGTAAEMVGVGGHPS